MTSRERVRNALEHNEPDRVPVDFGGHRSSGIAAIAYAKLKKALGITDGDIYVYDMLQQLAIVETEVLDALAVDTVELGRAFMTEKMDWQDWVLPDGTPCKIPAYINAEKRADDWYLVSDAGRDLAIQKKGCFYFEQIYWPWQDRNPEKQDFDDIAQALADNMWGGVPTPGGHIALTDNGLKELVQGAKKLRESTDRAIVGVFGGNLFEVPQFLYRMDNYLLHMGMYPEACKRLSKALCDFYIDNLEKWLGAVGPYIDVVLFGDDLGGQNGPLMSPEMYRSYYKPYHARMWKRVKELTPNTFTNLHCCGGVEPLLGDLIEAGLESINPVQITCAGMDTATLKNKYGNDITFWGGGCDTRSILPHATPDEVRQHVLEQIEIMNQEGGFIFQQVHNIQADVPPENIIAMFEAVKAMK